MGDKIASGQCKICSAQGVGVQMFDLRGRPVLFHCARCESDYFNRLSMLDKERWLKSCNT